MGNSRAKCLCIIISFIKDWGVTIGRRIFLERDEFAVKFLDSNLEFIYNKVST